MDAQGIAATVGAVGFAVGAGAGYLHLRRHGRWLRAVVWIAVLPAIGVNAAVMLRSVNQHGLVATLRTDFHSALLLALLIGLVGIATHLSAVLRGLDGFLFAAAAAVELSASVLAREPAATMTARPWFISHGIAFALSGTFFVAGGAAGIAYLLVDRMLRRRRAASTLVGNVAPLEALERFGRWTPIVGFPLLTYGILTGFCGLAHRADLGAKALLADVSFLASMVAWLIYAYLAYGLMYRPRFRGRRAALLASCGMGLIVVVFIARELFSPLHQS